jgi:hypothetical protein
MAARSRALETISEMRRDFSMAAAVWRAMVLRSLRLAAE